jgi:hypothetical protein
VPRNTTTVGFDPVLLARSASRGVTTATLAFKTIGKLIARHRTAVKEYSEDAHLKMMATTLGADPFAIKMVITKFVQKLIQRASITDQYRIAAHGFVALFIEMLEGLESSNDIIDVIRSLKFFCQAGYALQSGVNHFLEQIADPGGIELLMIFRSTGRMQRGWPLSPCSRR